MFKNIFTKTLYEKRWVMLFWALGIAAMTLLTLSFYPSFREGGFDDALKTLPKSLQAITGNLQSLKSVSGYIAQQLFALRVPLLGLIMGISLFTSLLAGDENEGTLQALLTQPVSRSRVFIQKYLAGALISFVVCAGAIVGVLLALSIIHESFSFGLLLEATVGAWLLVLLFGTIGYALGAITGKRGAAGGMTGLLAFGGYLINSLTPNVPSLESIDKILPFHYYNNPPTAVSGLNAQNVIVTLGTITILLLISGLVFSRRDIYQR
ncbi:MAG: ABC transporter permease subunit [Patescibacteria group bacterium]